MKVVLFLLGALGYGAAFMTSPATSRSERTKIFGGSSGYATTLEGKKERVEQIQNLLETSQMVFTVPSGSITVSQTETLRRSLPEGTTAAVVKNTLMQRAISGTDFESASEMLKGPNMWFFIEDDIGASIKAYNGFIKDNGLEESHSIIGGVMDSAVYDAKGVIQIGKLPSKLELYAQIAGSIKAVPTTLARVIKAPNAKLARAIKLATMPEE
mmetsp:Transcript_27585/g.41737  ORF Transcript_27585/g.41737 Transcript_27585/m.41737 type:complete len:213 (+) Transcript_27585:106-744(+)|eukprot:CAMPEP_0178916316 /NCGR_PEP_ID=MMETSP0786-20121207/12554_1 /TAXON_ID=186022 /ORGANISM="Thalassionema frauenfeldii, Strain CCMP 1798" /LENGTH=212 /DNA_ID=CAMNT_0020589603 /DNA_START=93 /DNA_END=731 /DNA_ORIENTATION=+